MPVDFRIFLKESNLMTFPIPPVRLRWAPWWFIRKEKKNPTNIENLEYKV